MTGEQLVLLIQGATETATSNNNVRDGRNLSTSAKVLLRGYKELSAFLKCSVPTACRIVSRGDIRKPAIIRSAKTLLFDPELVVLQLPEVDSRWQINKNSKKQIK